MEPCQEIAVSTDSLLFRQTSGSRRVTRNKGKRTSGIDGEKWLTSTSKMKAVLSLTGKGYKAKPLKRVFINKPGKKKKRPLDIPTMYDRAIQSLYSLALEPIAKTMSCLLYTSPSPRDRQKSR